MSPVRERAGTDPGGWPPLVADRLRSLAASPAAKRALTVLLGLLLVLLVSEGALRLLFPRGVAVPLGNELWPWLERDPILGWRNQAHYGDGQVAINALHFRGPAIERGKPAGALRLICLGDSRTFGIWTDLGGYRYDNDYPRLLDRRLRASRELPPVEVINAGVIGHTVAHGLRQLRTRLWALEPDVLVVAYGLNELAPAWEPALRAREPRPPFRGLQAAAAPLRLAQLGLHAYQSLPVLHPPPLALSWLSDEEYLDHLERLAAAARRRRTPILFLDLPLRPLEQGESERAFPGAVPNYELRGAQSLADLHRRYDERRRLRRELADRESLPLVDLGAALLAHPGPAAFGPYDVVHMNPEGAALVAETVLDRLLELGWLSP